MSRIPAPIAPTALFLSALLLTGCGNAPSATAASHAAEAPPATESDVAGGSAAPASAPADALPTLVMHKTPTCGCCGAWAERMREAGFEVEERISRDLSPVKARLGIPMAKASCHTTEVAGYAIEGHVPAIDIKRLLAEKPDAIGLAVPGMPAGSPGMEHPEGYVSAYTVELLRRDGSSEDYARHGD